MRVWDLVGWSCLTQAELLDVCHSNPCRGMWGTLDPEAREKDAEGEEEKKGKIPWTPRRGDEEEEEEEEEEEGEDAGRKQGWGR